MSINPASGCSSNAVCQPSGSKASGSTLPENTMTTGVATALMPRSFSAAVVATLSSITIDADSSSASHADSTKASPAAALGGSCHAHSFRPASGNATAAKGRHQRQARQHARGDPAGAAHEPQRVGVHRAQPVVGHGAGAHGLRHFGVAQPGQQHEQSPGPARCR
jgi:hypothetical protein